MWRGLLAVAVVYGCGHPKLEGYRPAALNAPLQAFYQQVNAAAHDGQMALASVNTARTRYLKSYMKQAEQQLRNTHLMGSSDQTGSTPATGQ
jgi:hypothetical protein